MAADHGPFPVETKPDILSLLFSGKMVLPFEPLTLVFEDLEYYVETPVVRSRYYERF